MLLMGEPYTATIFLIGYRCTGKTTVGKMLAERLGWSFLDTDNLVVQNAGVSIAQLVASHGWLRFREHERMTLQAVSAGSRQVVATGGGIVLDARNANTMSKAGKVVWLTADVKTIQARMHSDGVTAGSRPALTKRGAMGEIEAVLAERSPLYRAAADLIVDTDGQTIAAVCDRILGKLGIENYRKGRCSAGPSNPQ
jgi:shikimate kinase